MREELGSDAEELEYLVEGRFSRRLQGRPKDAGFISKRWLTIDKMLETVGLGCVEEACSDFEKMAPKKRQAKMEAAVEAVGEQNQRTESRATVEVEAATSGNLGNGVARRRLHRIDSETEGLGNAETANVVAEGE